MATGYSKVILIFGSLFLFCCLEQSTVRGQHVQPPRDYLSIRNKYALIADQGLIRLFGEDCVKNKYRQRIGESTSIETLIEFVQRLEDTLANTTDSILTNFKSPDMVARLILQRFNLDNVNLFEGKTPSDRGALIDTYIIGRTPGVQDWYYFPDAIFSETELCTWWNMFSHTYVNSSSATSTRRTRRATYNFQRQSNPNNPVASPYLDLDNNDNNNNNGNPINSDSFQNATQETGVVSFRQDPREAIAPARVLMGIIAALSENALLSGQQISNKLDVGTMEEEANLKDAVGALTLGSLLGQAVFAEQSVGSQPNNAQYDPNLIFGLTGQWANSSCCTFYSVDNVRNIWQLRRSAKASQAELRGALDGYIIGTALKQLSSDQTKKMKLSMILKSYYGPSKRSGNSASTFSASYCDRSVLKPSDSVIREIGEAYSRVYKFFTSQEKSVLRQENFMNALNQAASTNSLCTANTQNEPCETPSDLIFVVDGSDENKRQSANFIQQLVSRIPNIGRYAGAVSVFTSSTGNPNNIEMPAGQWPLGVLAFNNTNPGSLYCSLTPDLQSSNSQSNLGRYFLNLNTTLMQYKWWTWRRNLGGVPSRNVILLSLGKTTKPTSGQDLTDYNDYSKSLKYRSRDVLFLVATSQKDQFTSIVRDQKFIVSDQDIQLQNSRSNLASEWANAICENPATLQYNDCRERSSQNFTHDLMITAGFKQHWAVYPQYFKLSDSVDFNVKAHEGSVRVCWDRQFPPENPSNCKEVQAQASEYFSYGKPCKGESVHTCKPIYITVTGRELKEPYCNDPECLNFQQIKVTISHTGMRCGAMGLTVSLLLTSLLALVPAILNIRN